MTIRTQTLIDEMIRYDAGSPHRIQHFLKVHAFSRQIGLLEGLPEEEQYALEIAALTHDIGIRVCEEKYGRHPGPLQEKEGPAVARDMLTRLGGDEALIERVCYLIGHHHTYAAIDGQDYQILVEADFLVNLFEDSSNRQTIDEVYQNIFKTHAGRDICRVMFGIA